jgi:hypothetical protein
VINGALAWPGFIGRVYLQAIGHELFYLKPLDRGFFI